MLRNLSSASERFLADLERIQSVGERAQQQITSGLRISRPSDAPDEVAAILQIRADIERNTQIEQNLSRIKAGADTAESTVATAIKLVDRAQVLAAQGAGSLATPLARQSMAQEVAGILDQLVGLTRTQVSGRFIFSGSADQAPLYAAGSSSGNGVKRLAIPQPGPQAQDSDGISFVVSRNAQQIFDDRNSDDTLSPNNVFAAVNALSVALQNSDQAGINAALTALRRGSDHLNVQLSFYGAVQTRIAASTGLANRRAVELTQQLSNQRDTDIAAASLEMMQSRTREEAAISAQSHMPRTSLFDFLR